MQETSRIKQIKDKASQWPFIVNYGIYARTAQNLSVQSKIAQTPV